MALLSFWRMKCLNLCLLQDIAETFTKVETPMTDNDPITDK